MSKQGKIYVIIGVLAILAMVMLEYSKPKKVNWFPSYAKQHKIPFGTYVFHDQLERLFSDENVVDVNRPPYEYLENQENLQGTYLFVNNNIEFDDVELDALLDWTSKGNTLFIATEAFSKNLIDTLKIKHINLFNYGTNFYVELKNRQVKKDSLYTFERDDVIHYFNRMDTLQVSALGVVHYSDKIDTLKTKISHLVDKTRDSTLLHKDFVNVIKQPFGQGEIILSMFPQAFTNYFLLHTPNQNYTAGLLSYIDGSKPIFLDGYYKSGKKLYISPLRVLLGSEELKWAYYIMLIGVLIYVIFEGKRKQRAIPVITPLRNQTLHLLNLFF